MSTTIDLLKLLGRKAQATEVLEAFVTYHRENKNIFDMNSSGFVHLVNEPQVLEAFRAKLNSIRDKRDPATALLEMSSGWSRADIELLSRMSIEDYCAMFRNIRGEQLPKSIFNCLQFAGMSNAPDAEKEVAKRAREALTKIGQECSINAIRVIRKYGIPANAVTLAESTGKD